MRGHERFPPATLARLFLGATKHLYNWLCPLVGWSVGLLVGRTVGRVTHSFDDPHVAPYWPTWPCLIFKQKNTSVTLLAALKNWLLDRLIIFEQRNLAKKRRVFSSFSFLIFLLQNR